MKGRREQWDVCHDEGYCGNPFSSIRVHDVIITYCSGHCSHSLVWNTAAWLFTKVEKILYNRQKLNFFTELLFHWLHVKHCIDWKAFLFEHTPTCAHQPPVHADVLWNVIPWFQHSHPQNRGENRQSLRWALLSRNILPPHVREIRRVIIINLHFKKHASHSLPKIMHSARIFYREPALLLDTFPSPYSLLVL